MSIQVLYLSVQQPLSHVWHLILNYLNLKMQLLGDISLAQVLHGHTDSTEWNPFQHHEVLLNSIGWQLLLEEEMSVDL